MSGKTTSVAAAAKESSASSSSIGACMGEAAKKLSTVASATEEMNTTINEIAPVGSMYRQAPRHCPIWHNSSRDWWVHKAEAVMDLQCLIRKVSLNLLFHIHAVTDS
jgi:hypothetical protein